MKIVWVIAFFGLLSFFNPSRGSAEAISLDQYASVAFSQDGEDGVLEKIFEIVKPTNKYAVEFGAGDGVSLSNTRNLILKHGWSALLMEGDEALAREMQHHYSDNLRVRAIQAWIYPGNVETLFEENGVPKDLDLLSIDIDSNDYYVWKVIHNFHPKVVVIEYNSSFPPPLKRVVDFHPMNYWDNQSDYFGASIQSLYELGKKKGYELIYVTPSGINLIFVEKKYYALFGLKDNSPQKMYRPPQYGEAPAGRAPNGKGWPMYEKQGSQDLEIGQFRIPKKMVER